MRHPFFWGVVVGLGAMYVVHWVAPQGKAVGQG
jgi:hypothetical protein